MSSEFLYACKNTLTSVLYGFNDGVLSTASP